jgi:hypothetical protein
MTAVLFGGIPEPYHRNPAHFEVGEDIMSANISVIGVHDGMGGLKESLTKFRKHHDEVGSALMNISGIGTATGGKVDKDEPRPAYRHEEWPRMVYHSDGREEIAVAPQDYKEFVRKGFRDEPYPKPQIAVLDPATEKQALADHNKQLQSQITIQNELLSKLQARLETIEAAGRK